MTVASDDRERDAEIAEHLFGWQRTYNAGRTGQGRRGWLLLGPDDPRPEWWVPASPDVERSEQFWFYMDGRIPKYSTDHAQIWPLVARIVPEEQAIRSKDATVIASMIVPPVPPERQHAVVIRAGSGELFLDWHVDIRTRDDRRSICGAAGNSLPRVVATAIKTLIEVEKWVVGRRTDICDACTRFYGAPTACSGRPPH
jgi:hypothetical protein